MLSLTRKINERLVIGDAVVEVLDLGGGRVRLGVSAPRETRIVREELLPADHPARRRPLARNDAKEQS